MAPQRRFFLGDEWVYYKIYSGPKKAEELLTGEICELVMDLYEDKKIKKFFFIRYGDDDGSHIRLRFLVSKNEYIYDVIKGVFERLNKFVQLRVISKISTDTYNRELERYGIETIEDIETIFSHNSWDCMMSLSQLIKDDDTLRWLHSIKQVDKLLNKLGLSIEEKYDFCNHCFEARTNNQPANKQMKVSLDTRYREYSKQIGECLHFTEKDNEPDFSICLYTDDLDKAINNILALYRGKENFYNLLHSIVHMHFNRFFRTKQTTNELVIYYLMAKYYKSYASRLKYSS